MVAGLVLIYEEIMEIGPGGSEHWVRSSVSYSGDGFQAAARRATPCRVRRQCFSKFNVRVDVTRNR